MQSMLNKFLILTLFLFYSCTHSLKFGASKCDNKTQFITGLKSYDFQIKDTVTLLNVFGNTNYDINEILKVNGIDCKNVKAVNVYVYKTKGQAIASLFPFYSQRTIEINGILNNSILVMEDE